MSCQDLYVTQILREINFGEFDSSETVVICNVRDSEFCKFDKSLPCKSAKIHKNQNSKPLSVLKWQSLRL